MYRGEGAAYKEFEKADFKRAVRHFEALRSVACVMNQLRAGPCEALRLDDKLLIKQHEDTKAKFEKGCLLQR